MSSTSLTTTCALVTLLMAAPSCSRNDGSQNAAQLRASLGVDLASVAGFVLTRGATGSASFHTEGNSAGGAGGASAASELYTLNKDGSLTVVTVTEGGAASSSVSPLAVFDTKTWVLVAYNGVSHDQDSCNFVAARKADGALYCVTAPNNGFAQVPQRGTQYGSLVQSDATGDLVWINHDNGVTLLDLTDPSKLTQTTPAGSDVQGPNGPPGGPFALAVNDAGDALITGRDSSTQYTRVFFPRGGFFNVSDAGESCLVSGGSGDPGDFYYTTNGPGALVELAATSATMFTKTTLISIPLFACSGGLAKMGSHVFLTGDPGGPQANQMIDLAGDTPTVRSVDALATITQVAGCDASLFVLGTDASGNGGVIRYDVAGAVFTTLVAPGAYALSTMAVSPGCEVTFYGQRAADGAYILGTIPAGSDAVTVDATGFPAVTQIDRIN